jgi:hypothetical protein
VPDSDVEVDVLVLVDPLAGRVDAVPVPGRLGAVTGEPAVVVGVEAVVVDVPLEVELVPDVPGTDFTLTVVCDGPEEL